MTERNRKVFKTPQQLEQPLVRCARLGLAEEEKLSNRLQIWKKEENTADTDFFYFSTGPFSIEIMTKWEQGRTTGLHNYFPLCFRP